MGDILAGLRNWAARQPPDARVRWWDDHGSIREVHTGWVDVQVEGIPGYNWIWTIVDPDDPAQEPDPTTVRVDCSHDVHGIWDPSIWALLDDPVVVVAHDHALAADELSGLEAAVDPTAGRSLACQPGWHHDRISPVLGEWVAVHLGRGDIDFYFEQGPMSTMLRAAPEAAEAIEANEKDTYQVRDGVHVTDEVMDVLLDGPIVERPVARTAGRPATPNTRMPPGCLPA